MVADLQYSFAVLGAPVFCNSSVPSHFKRPVGSFWWRNVMSLSMDFRGLASCSFGDGTSVSFWEDIWDMGLLKLEFPQLFSFAKDTKISVATFLSRDIENNFLLPLSLEASMQLTGFHF
jgi:hypothetical protein